MNRKRVRLNVSRGGLVRTGEDRRTHEEANVVADGLSKDALCVRMNEKRLDLLTL